MFDGPIVPGPLPRINELLGALKQSAWYTTLDLASGFWQIEMHPRDREKTAFTSRFGLYEFNVMPFGLTNAPATFQRLMDRVLQDVLWKFALVYIDDVTIFSSSFEDHMIHLEEVLRRIQAANQKPLEPSADF